MMFRSIAMFSFAVVVGCIPQKKNVSDAVEKMPVPQCEPETIESRVKSCGTPLVWDFSKGLPAGGKMRKGGCASPDGICASDPTNLSLAAGFALDKLWTPQGAFLFEAEFVAGNLGASEMPDYRGILWDDLAITRSPKWTHRGFQLEITTRNGKWTPVLWTGFSNDTFSVQGPSARLAPGTSAKISFVYGANGRVYWEFGGRLEETMLPRTGFLAPSACFKPVIGDRACADHHPFNGTVKRVSITPCEVYPLGVSLEGRKVFIRGESGAKAAVKVVNLLGASVSDMQVTVEQFVGSGRVRMEKYAHGSLAAGECRIFEVPVETRVSTGWHAFRVTVLGKDAAGTEMREAHTLKLGIGPKSDDRMTVLMWGYQAPEAALAEYGFTHGLFCANPGEARFGRVCDNALLSGVRLMHWARTIYPDGKIDEKYVRKNRDGSVWGYGKKKELTPEISNPAFIETMKKHIAKDVELFGAHPGFVGVLAATEARDSTNPSFNTEHLRYRKETGRDIPPEVERGVLDYRGLAEYKKRFPDGVVPEDDPVLSYYRWFWKGGDGWPGYSGGIAEEYRKLISRPDFTVFWDPAVRCPPTWGSGGAVDMLNQWVYAVPEPMNVAGPAEEILAMAAGRPGQIPSIMTQLICYRTKVAPKDVKVVPEPEWVKRRPLADFPSIPPDTLQEATWSMLAKPVKAIMYHGWGTIYETGVSKGYVYTNPETAQMIKRLLKDVVAPLGPMLKRLGREAPPVAVLESFTTCALGGPASWGWTAPSITFLQRARLDPRVVYEDTIMRDGLEGIKVLYAPQCIFLTPQVVEKIKAFQANGGILIADKQLLKALKADVEVPVVSFKPPPVSDTIAGIEEMEASREGDAKTRLGTLRTKTTMVAQANDLRKDLMSRYVPAADSSSPEIVVYSRKWKNTRYVVAINDNRTFGDYMGPWGRTMEKGLPFAGDVSLEDDGEVKVVYELSRGVEMPFTREGGRIKVPVKYDTNDGRMFVFLRQKIASVKADAPESVRAGETVRVKMSALDAEGRPVEALLPAEIRLYDAAGRELDGAGWVCLEDGTCTVEILTNLDDAPGAYRLVCRDRATGLTVERSIQKPTR